MSKSCKSPKQVLQQTLCHALMMATNRFCGIDKQRSEAIYVALRVEYPSIAVKQLPRLISLLKLTAQIQDLKTEQESLLRGILADMKSESKPSEARAPKASSKVSVDIETRTDNSFGLE